MGFTAGLVYDLYNQMFDLEQRLDQLKTSQAALEEKRAELHAQMLLMERFGPQVYYMKPTDMKINDYWQRATVTGEDLQS